MSIYSLFAKKSGFDGDSLENRSETMIEWLSAPLGFFLKKYFRADVKGLERIPKGAALYVGNHNMAMLSLDSFIFASEAFKKHGMDAVPYGLAHDVAMFLPLARNFIASFGGIRASHENAAKIFSAGKKAIVYPGGDLDASRPFRHRDRVVFGGRTGYIRLALTENVPIVPVVAAGAHSVYIILTDGRGIARKLRFDKLFRSEVWPVTLCLPWGLAIGPTPFFLPFPAKILIEVMEPVRFDRSGPEAAADDMYVRQCADRVETAMQATLSRLARERKHPRRRVGERP